MHTIQDIEKTRRRMAEMARTSPPTPGVSGITLRRIGGRTYFEEPTWGIRRLDRQDAEIPRDFLEDTRARGLDLEQEKRRLTTLWESEPLELWQGNRWIGPEETPAAGTPEYSVPQRPHPSTHGPTGTKCAGENDSMGAKPRLKITRRRIGDHQHTGKSPPDEHTIPGMTEENTAR